MVTLIATGNTTTPSIFASASSDAPIVTTNVQGFFSPRPSSSFFAEHHPSTQQSTKSSRRRLSQTIICLGLLWAILVVFYSLPFSWEDESLTMSYYYRHGNTDNDDARYHRPSFTVDLSHNDPALRGLSQAECTIFWAPSIVHGMGVYTARDISRKALVQPFPDLCFYIPHDHLDLEVYTNVTAFQIQGRCRFDCNVAMEYRGWNILLVCDT